MQRQLRLAVVGSIVLALLVLVFSVAYASSIVVDGLPGEWSLVERVYEEFPEAITPPDVELTNVFFTNDQQNLYWRFDTLADTDWDSDIGYLAICLDIQPIATEVLFGPCYADYVLKIEPGFATVDLWNASTGEQVITATISAASQFTVTEVAIKLSDVGIDLSTCSAGCYINAKLVLDASQVFLTSTGGGMEPTFVDRVPDGGTVPDPAQPYITFSARVGAGSPTAINLAEFNVRVVNTRPFDWRVVVALSVLVTGLIVVRRVKN